MPEDERRVLTVEVVVPGATPSFSGALLRVGLEDTSMADRPALTLSRTEVPGLAHRQGHMSSFRALLSLPRTTKGTRHELSVHLDVDRDGALGRGDLINMESYSVEIGSPPHLVRVMLRAIE